MMNELLIAIITALIGIVTGYGELERRRIIKILTSLETENAKLKTKISDQTTQIADANTRIDNLQGFKTMYNLLNTNHEQLQKDHDDLKQEFDQKKTEWETAQHERDAERVKSADMLTQNNGLFEANKKLAATILNYEQAFKLLGQKLTVDAEKQSPAPEPGESPAPAIAEASEVKSKETS